mmetsp:Transcript_15937/g.37242  ORF Transcript_15937/g.37242 Transcript_15937/m.37242 type:complete len:519 (-) Transcript_15937:53-1609(-)
MEAVHAGGGEVRVERVHFEARQGVEVVPEPVPGVAHDVVEARARGRHGVHGARRAPPQVGVVLARRVVPRVLHHRVARVGVRMRVCLRALCVPDRVVLPLGEEAVGEGGAVDGGAPDAVRLRLVRVHLHGPRERQGDHLEDAPEFVLVQPDRPVGHPECREQHVPEHPPLPAGFRPARLVRVPSGRSKLEEFGVCDEELGGLERHHLHLTRSILVIPPEGRKVLGLPEGDLPARVLNHRVLHHAPAVTINRGRMQHRKVLGARHEIRGQLAHQHRGRFQVDPLVLEPHDEGPARGVHGDRHGVVSVEDHVLDDVVHLPAVLGDLPEARPLHLVLREVVPRHLVHARFHDLLHVVVHPLVEQAGDAALVDVHARHMPVVEDQRVPQLVPGAALESLFSHEAREHGLGEGPCVVEIVQQLLAGGVARDERQRRHHPICIHPGAHPVHRRLSCPPPVLLRVGVVIRGLPILCALMCPEVHVQVAVRVAVQPGVHLGRHCVGNQEPLRKWRRISLCPVITGA